MEKNNLDLELEIKKLKHVLLTKNVDLSVIVPNNAQNSRIYDWSSNK
jgi:hypothetical protein